MSRMRSVLPVVLLTIIISDKSISGVGLSGTGITFPDATVQTTAAEIQEKCTAIVQADVPLTITKSGVYCLAEDIISALTPFTIDANNVAINLNGHTIDGSGGGRDTTQIGVYCEDQNYPIITNGTITGYNRGAAFYNCDGGEVTHIRATKNHSIGIHVFNGSEGVLIANNHIFDIGDPTRTDDQSSAGISVGSNSSGIRIQNNVIHKIYSTGEAAATGIRVTVDHAVVTNNSISGLSPDGDGFQNPINFVGYGGIIAHNMIIGVATSGIYVSGFGLCSDNKVLGCTVAISGCHDGGDNVTVP